MIVIHRRLFWKIYLTLLSSLVAVAVLMGCLWWLLGETPSERGSAFRAHVSDELAPERASTTAIVAETIERLGRESGADISVYGSDHRLIAVHGMPVTIAAGSEAAEQEPHRMMRIDLPDGRTALARLHMPPGTRGLRILSVMIVVAAGVGLAAFPMTARLTRQLERLRSGVARWGEGELSARVDETGSDEVAAVARTFNAAAERVNTLLVSQKALLANASHELRSPIARLRLGADLWLQHPSDDGRREIVRNLAELDQLVGEILLCSRLDHPSSTIGHIEAVDLLGLAAEEAARVGAVVEGEAVEMQGNETLLRRLLRNLLENGTNHGREPVCVTVTRAGDAVQVIVSDAGQGIPPTERERVFEPFYRPTGRSESGGGWGLGLTLVRQIATRHGGQVRCDGEAGEGSRFIVTLPGTQEVQERRETFAGRAERDPIPRQTADDGTPVLQG